MRIPDEYATLMREAISQAHLARATADVPIGALIVDAQGQIVARGCNRRQADHDPTAHAEIVAIRAAASSLGTSRLDGCVLVTTLEPCVMCAGAALTARVRRIVFGAWDAKAGAAGSVYDLPRDGRIPLRAEVIGGVLAEECARLLPEFFKRGEG